MSHSILAFQALNSLVPGHWAIDEIWGSVKLSKVEVHMQWIHAHVRHTYNERADVVTKVIAMTPKVEVVVTITYHQAKREYSTIPCLSVRRGELRREQ